MASPDVLEYIELGEDEALIETQVPEQWVDKSLAELQLSSRKGVTVVALKAKGRSGSLPKGDTVLREGDVIVLGGLKKNLDRLNIFRG